MDTDINSLSSLYERDPTVDMNDPKPNYFYYCTPSDLSLLVANPVRWSEEAIQLFLGLPTDIYIYMASLDVRVYRVLLQIPAFARVSIEPNIQSYFRQLYGRTIHRVYNDIPSSVNPFYGYSGVCKLSMNALCTKPHTESESPSVVLRVEFPIEHTEGFLCELWHYVGRLHRMDTSKPAYSLKIKYRGADIVYEEYWFHGELTGSCLIVRRAGESPATARGLEEITENINKSTELRQFITSCVEEKSSRTKDGYAYLRPYNIAWRKEGELVTDNPLLTGDNCDHVITL